MLIFRLILFSAAALVMADAASLDASYVGGTVKAIPVNAPGSLDLNNGSELKFRYGQSIYRIPYAQITGSDTYSVEGRKLFGHLPVPSVVPGKRKRTLAITYKDADGGRGVLNFELTGREASSAQDIISARLDVVNSPQIAASADESWWGDKYWKTNRNRSIWASEKPAEAAQGTQTIASGTK